jgi:hypothetical protein
MRVIFAIVLALAILGGLFATRASAVPLPLAQADGPNFKRESCRANRAPGDRLLDFVAARETAPPGAIRTADDADRNVMQRLTCLMLGH